MRKRETDASGWNQREGNISTASYTLDLGKFTSPKEKYLEFITTIWRKGSLPLYGEIHFSRSLR
jgi:hypothetical protein